MNSQPIKLIYLLPTNDEHQGIARKIKGQVTTFQKHFHTSLQTYPYKSKESRIIKGLRYLVFHIKALKSLNNQVVYYRYNPKFPLLHLYLWGLSFFKLIFFEHNTNYTTELTYLNRSAEATLHRITMKLLKYSRINHVSVTPEIKETLGLNLTHHLYIQNGYMEDSTSHADTLPEAVIQKLDAIRAGNSLKIGVFVGNGYGWHGIPELIATIHNYPDIHILIVGPYANTPSPVPNISFIGKLSQSELKTLYRYCDFGIGPLRYDHIQLTKGASLKVREYLFSGLMLWLHFDDCVTDFPELAPYIFIETPRSNGLNRLIDTSPNKEEIQSLAKKYLSWDHLLDPLITLIKKEVKV